MFDLWPPFFQFIWVLLLSTKGAKITISKTLINTCFQLGTLYKSFYLKGFLFPYCLYLKESYSVLFFCQKMPKRHIMSYKHSEVSPAGCFGWLCTRCFRSSFQILLLHWRQCVLDFPICASPCMPAPCTALCLSPPKLHWHHCALHSASGITVSTLF